MRSVNLRESQPTHGISRGRRPSAGCRGEIELCHGGRRHGRPFSARQSCSTWLSSCAANLATQSPSVRRPWLRWTPPRCHSAGDRDCVGRARCPSYQKWLALPRRVCVLETPDTRVDRESAVLFRSRHSHPLLAPIGVPSFPAAIERPVERPAKPVNRLLCVPMGRPQPDRRFAISARTAGTSSTAIPIAVCVVDPRSLSSRSVFHGPAKHVFDFGLCHAMAVDVGLVRLRINVVANVHTRMLSPSPVRSN